MSFDISPFTGVPILLMAILGLVLAGKPTTYRIGLGLLGAAAVGLVLIAWMALRY